MDKSEYQAMDQNFQNIEQHVKILGWLHIILSGLMIPIAIFVFLILAGTGVFSGDADAAVILPIIGVAVSGFLIVLAIPGILGGWGLLKRKSWARLVALIIGCLNLLSFPFGTALGVYTLWVLLQDGASDYFAQTK